MAVTVLLQFTQALNIGLSGEALIGDLDVVSGPVTVSDTGAGATTWTFEILEAPPGSATVTGIVQGPGALSSFILFPGPDVPGSYRFRLTGTDGVDTDVDIRNLIVPDVKGVIYPPYQKNPDPIDLTLKPDEMNYGGQGRGWAGTNTTPVRGQHRVLQTINDYVEALISVAAVTLGEASVDVYGVRTTFIAAPSVVTLDTTVRVGQGLTFIDVEGTAAVNTVTINLSGFETFVDGTTSVVISSNYGSTRLRKITALLWMVEIVSSTGGFPGFGGAPPGTAVASAAGISPLASRSDHTHARGPEPAIFRLSGPYSGAIVPGLYDPPHYCEQARTIVGVDLFRRTAGSANFTQIDVQVNGVSIYALLVDHPIILFGAGNNAYNAGGPIAFPAVAPGQYIDVVLEAVEGFLLGPPVGPEGLFAKVRFA